MPVNKDALKRYQIIDKLLSNPNRDYTTNDIAEIVNRECDPVSIRMIQKDIFTLQEDFGKQLIRNAGGRGTVKYADQSSPLFYQELTENEEEILREALRSLGQFDGLDNFTWLESLKKKLSVNESSNQRPVISFSKNDGLQIPPTLLGRLFSAISEKKTIQITYTKFGETPNKFKLFPYQLKQYNDRWFLLASIVPEKKQQFNSGEVYTFALDRISEHFEYLDNIQYIDTTVNLKERFDEIIGVTLYADKEVVDIYFAVSPKRTPYVRTKWLHTTQIELDQESSSFFRNKYPSLSEYTFFSIECRENKELYALFASFSNDIILLEPIEMREKLSTLLSQASAAYTKL